MVWDNMAGVGEGGGGGEEGKKGTAKIWGRERMEEIRGWIGNWGCPPLILLPLQDIKGGSRYCVGGFLVKGEGRAVLMQSLDGAPSFIPNII